MTAGVLLDTNILVYAYDRSDRPKQQRAVEVLDALASRRGAAISTQVLGEFFSTVTRKLASPLSAEEAFDRVAHYVQAWTILDLTAWVVLEAIRGSRVHRLNYWDAQIWAAARVNQIPVIFSEDFSHGTLLQGVRFINPFHSGFRLDDWTG
jgi:predicted nucleic acid-binding protein